jgi:hypothetical protein
LKDLREILRDFRELDLIELLRDLRELLRDLRELD